MSRSSYNPFISFFRVLLILLVVVQHCMMSPLDVASPALYPHFMGLMDFISRFLQPGPVATGLFFALSGYLFFHSFPIVWREKYRSRLYTLLIPYLLWNLYALLLYAGGQAAGLFPARFLPFGQMDGWGWLSLFTSNPVNGPLWFLRDLILLALVSPLISLLRRGGYLWPLALLLLNGWLDNHYLQALLFYWIGAATTFSPERYKPAMGPLFWGSAALYIACCMLFPPIGYGANLVGSLQLLALMGLTFVAARALYGTSLSRLSGVGGAAVLFVYGLHGPLCRGAIKLFVTTAPAAPDFVYILFFILLPIVMALLSFGLYRLSCRCFPALTRLLTGGRS